MPAVRNVKKKKPPSKPLKPGGSILPASERNIPIQREKAREYHNLLVIRLKEVFRRRRVDRFLTQANKFGFSKLFVKPGVKQYFAEIGLNVEAATMLFADIAVSARVNPAHMVKLLEYVLSHPQASSLLKETITQKPYTDLVELFRRLKKQVPLPRPR